MNARIRLPKDKLDLLYIRAYHYLEGYKLNETNLEQIIISFKLNEYEIKAMPLVMKCIELLFIAYFNNLNDDKSATEALKIYNIVKNEL